MIDVLSNKVESIDEKVVKNDEVNEEIENVMIEDEPIKKELKEEDKQDYKTIRTQQLVECPKCKKMMTATSLKYYHKKTCPAEPVAEPKPKSNTKPKKEEVVIVESDEEVKIIKPKPKKAEVIVESDEEVKIIKPKPKKVEVVIVESDEEVKIIKPKPKKEVVLEQQPVLNYQQQRMQQRQLKINTLFMGAI